jgi:DNA-binding Xre family transcriptional regulator
VITSRTVFVIEIRPDRGRQLLPAGERPSDVGFPRIAGHRVRSRDQLRSVFLEERGARRPSLFVASTAAPLGALADVVHDERGNLRLFLFGSVDPPRREFLQTLFRTVVSSMDAIRLLAGEELVEALSAENRHDVFVGGAVDRVDEVVVLYRGSLDRLSVPFGWFRREGAERPDFGALRITDHGQTLELGGLGVAADAVLYDFDPEYRRRAKKRQLQLDESLGGALRRLRELRGLRQSDFASITEKTIARIERGEVERPRERTIQAIARRLGVTPEELMTY